MEHNGFPEARFEFDDSYSWFMVTLPIHRFMSVAEVFMSVAEDDRKETISLSTRQEEILSRIEINDRITTEEIRSHFAVSMPTINRDIAFLKRNGVFLRIGGKKSGSWLIAKKVK